MSGEARALWICVRVCPCREAVAAHVDVWDFSLAISLEAAQAARALALLLRGVVKVGQGGAARDEEERGQEEGASTRGGASPRGRGGSLRHHVAK